LERLSVVVELQAWWWDSSAKLVESFSTLKWDTGQLKSFAFNLSLCVFSPRKKPWFQILSSLLKDGSHRIEKAGFSVLSI